GVAGRSATALGLRGRARLPRTVCPLPDAESGPCPGGLVMQREGGRAPRLLFCSYHCYCDPSSGAALATRDTLEMVAGHGWPCGVYSGPQLDFQVPQPLAPLLRGHRLSFEEQRGSVGGVPFALFHFVQGGVPVTVFRPDNAGSHLPPGPSEGEAFLT